MTEVVFAFTTQEQADACVAVLSKGYEVTQFFAEFLITSKPYCVKVYVPNRAIEQKGSEEQEE